MILVLKRPKRRSFGPYFRILVFATREADVLLSIIVEICKGFAFETFFREGRKCNHSSVWLRIGAILRTEPFPKYIPRIRSLFFTMTKESL